MDVFDLFARLTLDKSDYDEKLKGAGKSADSFASKIGTGIATAAKVGAKGITAIAGATTTLSGLSVKSYATYEQMIGGVETLFGDAAGRLEQYANEAYESSGLSANAYMEQATSFSASLLQSLGGDTKKAADMANTAIVDMSDNANKMGTDMEAIQNAYNGFAKQNYTMLDNLKLGYGGTKEEMERLLADAEKLTGQSYDVSSFADIVEAIHAVQEEMGIAGTTAEEAATTIEGSANTMKAAWQNVFTGLADPNQDIGELMQRAVDSTLTFGDNVIPRIEETLDGIGQAFDYLVPVVAEKLPGLAEKIIPGMVSAVGTLITTVGQAAIDGLPELESTVKDLLTKVTDALPEAIPELLEKVLPMITELSGSLRENAGELIDAGLALIESLAEGIANSLPVLIENIPTIVTNIAGIINDNSPKLLVTAAKIIVTLAKGIITSLPVIAANAGKIAASIVSVISAIGWLNLGKKIIKLFANGIKGVASLVTKSAKSTISGAIQYIKQLPDKALTWGKDFIEGFVKGIRSAIDSVKNVATGVAQTVESILGFSVPEEGPLSDADEYGGDFVDLLTTKIKSNAYKAENATRDMALRMSEAAQLGVDDDGLSLYGSSRRSGRTQSGALLTLLNRYLPLIAEGIQMDGKKVSKQLANYMDKDLGSIRRQRVRAN